MFDARRLVKAKVLKSAYSADGRKPVRDFADKRYLIQNETDLNRHGDPDQPVGAGAGAWASATATAQTGKRLKLTLIDMEIQISPLELALVLGTRI